MTSRTRAPHGVALALAAFLVLVALGGLAAVQTATAPSAAAHDFLVKTIPGDGATVDRMPATVRLVFDQPARKLGTKLIISGPQGPVQQGSPMLVDNEVRQSLKLGAPAGHYTVSWRITSADGHPVSGSFSFTAQAAAAGAPATSANRPIGIAKSTAKSSDSPSTAALTWGGGVGLVIVLVVIGWLISRKIGLAGSVSR